MKTYVPVLIVIAGFFSLPVFSQLKLLQPLNPVIKKSPFKVRTIEPVSEKIKPRSVTIKKPAVISIGFENINSSARLQCTQAKSRSSLVLQAERNTPQVVDIKWETKNLTDNSGFNVEQSFDDTTHFKVVDFLSAHLNSVGKEEYKVQDLNEYMNLTYYRLKQFKMDNSYVYSNIVSVDGVRPFKLFPNPVDNYLTMQIATQQTGKATIIVYDGLGRALSAKTTMLLKNVLNNQSISVVNLNAGIYYTKVFMADINIRSGVFIKK